MGSIVALDTCDNVPKIEKKVQELNVLPPFLNSEGFPYLINPQTKLELDFPHLFAAISRFLNSGKFTQYPDQADVSDLTGFAGDLTTFALDYNSQELQK
ncbi:MAG: hypothetical protein LBP35_07060 [Candidatus Ancillula trichonymphae]|jgi:hypothetical protein|nr:hypothetical protein [Candidatus Ancillula trichonymphae]